MMSSSYNDFHGEPRCHLTMKRSSIAPRVAPHDYSLPSRPSLRVRRGLMHWHLHDSGSSIALSSLTLRPCCSATRAQHNGSGVISRLSSRLTLLRTRCLERCIGDATPIHQTAYGGLRPIDWAIQALNAYRAIFYWIGPPGLTHRAQQSDLGVWGRPVTAQRRSCLEDGSYYASPSRRSTPQGSTDLAVRA